MKGIEAAGWKPSKYFEKVYMKYDDEWCYGLWLLADNQIHISKSKPNGRKDGETHILYEGECRDINHFCLITKQLSI